MMCLLFIDSESMPRKEQRVRRLLRNTLSDLPISSEMLLLLSITTSFRFRRLTSSLVIPIFKSMYI